MNARYPAGVNDSVIEDVYGPADLALRDEDATEIPDDISDRADLALAYLCGGLASALRMVLARPDVYEPTARRWLAAFDRVVESERAQEART